MTLFYLFGAVAVIASLLVIAQRNPVYSAFALVVTFCCLSAIYGLLGSPFIAVLQIVVYAGAIMVLFLFVLMLLNVRREEGPGRSKSMRISAGVLALAFVAEVLILLVLSGHHRGGAPGFTGVSVRQFSQVLFQRYGIAVELISMQLLFALVGALYLGRRR